MIKPRMLKKGDTVAFVAPASGLAALVPHRLKKAREFFESRRYPVRVFPSALSNEGLSSDTPQNRARDINDAFSDPMIGAIITTIGGNSSHQILEYLDFELIRNNPKIFCGYSDITSLHFAFHTRCDLVTFYGPTAIAEFGETLNLESFTVERFFAAVASTDPLGIVDHSRSWTDFKDLDWLKKEDLSIERQYVKNGGYEWLKPGTARGPILGGCLPSMMHTRGTSYWPDFSGRILLLETPEGERFDRGLSIANVDAYLADLRLSGVFDLVEGIVFGRGFGYDAEQIVSLKRSIEQNTRGYRFPIVYGVDTGHSDPMITIPLGVEVILDSRSNRIEITESGVR